MVTFKVGAMWCTIPSLVAEMCVHIAVFVKQADVESRAGGWVGANTDKLITDQ